MKQILQLLSTFLLVALMAVPSQSFAAFCQSNGGGEWSNPNTWLCNGVPGVPQPGDFIIITGSDLVTLSSTADLTSIHDDTPTTMVIFGTLMIVSSGSCENNACDIDLILDTDSEIFVETVAGIQEIGPGIGQKDIIIGGVSVLAPSDYPYGPGVLPDLSQLPLSLVSFEASTNEDFNLLEWNTEKEENVLEFQIEKAINAQEEFELIGRVNAVGNSETLISYSYEDRNPVSMAYYRLKMIDIDGSFQYSEVIAVKRDDIKPGKFDVYPVPLQSNVNIKLNSLTNYKATVTLTNLFGQVIQSEQVDVQRGQNVFSFMWDKPAAGIHFITIQNEQTQLVKQVF